MDPDFWEFEIPEPPQYVSYWELMAQEPTSEKILLMDAEDWCECAREEFSSAEEAWASTDETLIEELKPYVRSLLPFYFLDAGPDGLP